MDPPEDGGIYLAHAELDGFVVVRDTDPAIVEIRCSDEATMTMIDSMFERVENW
jgi:hypothetical protein